MSGPRPIGLKVRYFEDAERSLNTLTLVGIVLATLVLVCAMSSILSLIVYEIPIGSEFKSWHSYWAVIPAVMAPLLIMAMATAMFRNMKMGAHIFGFYYSLFHLAVLLAIFVVTMVDIFPCESADWWCYSTVTGKVSWRYWWYAASAWGQTLFLGLWLLVYYFLHKYAMELLDKARSSSTLESRKFGGKPAQVGYEALVATKVHKADHICAMDFFGGLGVAKQLD